MIEPADELRHIIARQMEVFGKCLAAWKSDYYERIGVAFELPTHFRKLTALENLAYFRALYRRPTLEPATVLAMVGLDEAGTMPVAQFSKGTQNRLSVARAPLHQPELLFLDEPTFGLDPINARRIRALLKAQQAAGATILLTTHNMAVAEELCDRVAFIVDGTIKLIDTPRALKLRYGEPSVQVEYAQNGRTAQQRFPMDGLGDNAHFRRLLRTEQVQTIHTQEATLEDIFVRVTGKGLVLLEKGEGTLSAQAVTPLRIGEYVAAKVVTLTALALVETVVLVELLVGARFAVLPLVAGVALAGALYCLVGLVAVARYAAINEYLLPSTLYTALLWIPLLAYMAQWRH